MEGFVRDQLWPALQRTSTQKLLVSSGRPFQRLQNSQFWSTAGRSSIFGFGAKARDNDAVMRFVRDHPLAGVNVIVTSPAMLIHGEACHELRTKVAGLRHCP